MRAESSNNDWIGFERRVASLLKNFGYEIDHDTKIAGGQTDVLAKSPRRTTPNLIVECKYHATEKTKVGIDEVENFIARAQRLRMDGEIDHGYLVTNTGFTSDAKACLSGPSGKYVFLVTYHELFATLVNADFYLSNAVTSYERSDQYSRYVDLRVVDTTAADGTIFDAYIGRWRPSANSPEAKSDPSGQPAFWILPNQEIERLIDLKCVSRPLPHIVQLSWPDFQKSLSQTSAQATKIRGEETAQSDAQYNRLLDIVALAKNTYAREIAARFDLQESEEVISLLEENPPTFPARVSELIKPLSAPRGLRKIWETHMSRARQQLAQQHEKGPPLASATPILTENAAALSEESPETELILLPIQNALASLNSFLSDPHNNLYVLLADYGAGKSTLLQRWMWQLSKQKLASRTDPSVRIPMLFNLREYNKVADFGKLIRGFLTDEADMTELSLPMFRALNAKGSFVLLLDGFDEMLSRVTRAERRRCFIEIAEYMTPRSKVAISGRPGYFPNQKELSDVLRILHKTESPRISHALGYGVHCLQLMDGYELESFLKLSSVSESAAAAKRLIETNPSLHDLARRPVLTTMIMESASDLEAKIKLEQISVRDLYQVYTDKWVQREEDRGSFRVLIDPTKKATFVRYMAMEMHLTGKLGINFRELGRQIQQQFNLDDLNLVDHFSHDILTCSFLNRTDDGEYRFIHKSFMEFFVALEFERGEGSPFVSRFDKALTMEMRAFLSPTGILGILQELRTHCLTAINRVRLWKEGAIKNQNFDLAGRLRDGEKVLSEVKDFLDEHLYNSMIFETVASNVNQRLVRVLSLFSSEGAEAQTVVETLVTWQKQLENHLSGKLAETPAATS